MKSVAKILILILVFSVEVSVRATTTQEQIQPENLIQFPEGCWQKSERCAIENKTNKVLTWPEKKVNLFLSTNSVVAKKTEQKFLLVSGRLYVQCKQAVEVKTSFLVVDCPEGSEFLIEQEKQQTKVTALNANLKLEAKGPSKEVILLQPGMLIEVGPVAKMGYSTVSFPRSVPLPWLILTWASAFDGGKDLLREKIATLLPVWKEQVESISSYNALVYNREVASHEEQLRQEQERRKKVEAENKKMRDLFKKKNYLD